MRLLHTADWHLGRIFHGVHLTEDQAVLLDQIVDLAAAEKVDAVVIAGDVYDRAVPPAEAVRLLSETLERLVRQVGCKVVVIAGNHDSPERLGFGAGILEGLGLHVFGPPASEPKPVVLVDDESLVLIFGLAYAEPAVARSVLEDDSLADHDAVLASQLAACRKVTQGARAKAGERKLISVVAAHAFVAGGEASESERPLSVGGAQVVDVSRFEGFDYAALGHLHRPQAAGSERVAYSGSLLPYSFAEAGQEKSVSLVGLPASGNLHVERVPLRPRRGVRVVEGTLAEVLASAAADPAPGDYLMASLTDEGVLRDPLGRLREVYPNLLHIARPGLELTAGAGPSAAARRKLGMADLFESFYAERRGRALSADQRALIASLADGLLREQREG